MFISVLTKCFTLAFTDLSGDFSSKYQRTEGTALFWKYQTKVTVGCFEEQAFQCSKLGMEKLFTCSVQHNMGILLKAER
jgi:hypothetical protein